MDKAHTFWMVGDYGDVMLLANPAQSDDATHG